MEYFEMRVRMAVLIAYAIVTSGGGTRKSFLAYFVANAMVWHVESM